MYIFINNGEYSLLILFRIVKKICCQRHFHTHILFNTKKIKISNHITFAFSSAFFYFYLRTIDFQICFLNFTQSLFVCFFFLLSIKFIKKITHIFTYIEQQQQQENDKIKNQTPSTLHYTNFFGFIPLDEQLEEGVGEGMGAIYNSNDNQRQFSVPHHHCGLSLSSMVTGLLGLFISRVMTSIGSSSPFHSISKLRINWKNKLDENSKQEKMKNSNIRIKSKRAHRRRLHIEKLGLFSQKTGMSSHRRQEGHLIEDWKIL